LIYLRIIIYKLSFVGKSNIIYGFYLQIYYIQILLTDLAYGTIYK